MPVINFPEPHLTYLNSVKPPNIQFTIIEDKEKLGKTANIPILEAQSGEFFCHFYLKTHLID